VGFERYLRKSIGFVVLIVAETIKKEVLLDRLRIIALDISRLDELKTTKENWHWFFDGKRPEVVQDPLYPLSYRSRGQVFTSQHHRRQQSSDQDAKRAFRHSRNIRRGFPKHSDGYRGTFTLVAIACIYLRLGPHVVFSTPTHYAADAICETIDKWKAITDFEMDPVRVYRPVSETQAFKAHGDKPSQGLGESEDSDEDDEPDSATDVVLPDPTEASGETKEGFVPQEVHMEAQLLMAELVEEEKVTQGSLYDIEQGKKTSYQSRETLGPVIRRSGEIFF
jgi:hypothetical protein